MARHVEETDRLLALRELNLLDTAPSESFDRITRMASQLFESPTAAVSLTDTDRQWFKSRVGCGPELARAEAPCHVVTESGEVVVISDLTLDPRYADGELVRNGMRFYAGAPLTTRDGLTLGAMCVLDTKPRTMTADQIAILTDLAAMVMAQVELQHALGRIDPSSGLPNRNQFAEDLEDLSRDHAGEQRVALLVDVAGPLQLNNAMRILGPSYLDDMIKTAATNVKEWLGGPATLYHVGVTQLAALLQEETAEHLFRRTETFLADMANQPYASNGIGMAPVFGLMPVRLGEVSAAQVLRAVHGAAQDARDVESGVALYSVALDDAHQRRYALLDAIRAELVETSGLSLVYQPRIDLTSGRCTGAEALLRWNHPTLGNIPPGEFIPLVEASELLRPLTQWVIDTALRQAAEWQRSKNKLRISVNVSPSNLEEGDFAARLAEAMQCYNVSPQALEIEFTEGGLIRHRAKILGNLAKIRKLGVICAIDDFGTGYSSFSYLKDIPAQIIKIDQSFVRSLAQNSPDRALVRGMISMAHELGLRVVAEGVETQFAYDFLRNSGCDEAQGYFISRPISPSAFETWLEAEDISASS